MDIFFFFFFFTHGAFIVHISIDIELKFDMLKMAGIVLFFGWAWNMIHQGSL